MAMLENGRVTLQQICTWIESKFAFFRVRKKWNNSIRHNLSLHYCFRKIDRNKYEKGKGGYWELGVDPKKCDRKRIRNRKSLQSKTIGMRANKNFNSSIRSRTGIRNTEKSKYCCYLVESEKNVLEPMVDAQSLPANKETNELLVNELNVQHSNVSSCNDLHHQNLNDVFITGVLSNSTVEDTTSSSEMCTTNSINSMQQNMQDQLDDDLQQGEESFQQLQKYQLGTIIISTSATDVEQASSTINNMFGENTNEQHQNLVLSNNTMLPRCGNIIISSYLANNNIDSNRHNFNEPLANQRMLRSNVIVEQANHPSFGTLSSLASSKTSTNEAIPHMEYSTVISDSFRPYIDGIEEAFQYLRSIDNSNREDILDNLLDISVSDY
ncbi:fork head protein homolog 2-like [Teleopsis dalmanni]|uniref:fork head protein homolog 2-like n=1 Tax=Teleopsis dalmanni TaxID=139649 RepID=UPI0018CED3B9|nr:fork head protein homolog 2-like [Teleopsis dalmanni]